MVIKLRGDWLRFYSRSRSRRSRRVASGWLRSFWDRNHLARVALAVMIAWLFGTVGIHFSERGHNPAFSTWSGSFWSVWVLLFSGLDQTPQTVAGKLFAMVLLGTGVGLAGLFTGTVASYLVERQLGRRDMHNFETEEHLVLCNWGPRGIEWIREVHSKMIQDKRPVVIIHDDPESISLPDVQDDHAFQDVYLIKGDPTNEVILRRAKVANAHTVVVFSDDRQGVHADGKTILNCIAIRNICRGTKAPNIAVECRNPNFHHHLLTAGANEVISSDEFGLKLLARTALFHGIARVYQELLSVGRDANEMYLLPVPEEFIGRDFVEISGMSSGGHPTRRKHGAQPRRRGVWPSSRWRPVDRPEPGLSPRRDDAADGASHGERGSRQGRPRGELT